jgi:hypothetical protein
METQLQVAGYFAENMNFSPRRRGVLNHEIHEQYEKIPDRLDGLAFPLTLNPQPSTGSRSLPLCLCGKK